MFITRNRREREKEEEQDENEKIRYKAALFIFLAKEEQLWLLWTKVKLADSIPFYSSFSPNTWLIVEKRGKHAERREKVERSLEGKRMEERRGAQVAHTWCTVVREVRFLSTSLQFYRSGRVSLCLYIYIQGDPRNMRFPSPIGLEIWPLQLVPQRFQYKK